MLGWERRVTGKIQAVDVAGGHVSMLQEPYVKELAQELQTGIDVALARTVKPKRWSPSAGPDGTPGASRADSASALEPSASDQFV